VLRLTTFNLLHGMPILDGMPQPQRDDAGRIIGPPQHTDDAALRAAVAQLGSDVLALQEVDRHQDRSGLHDQTAVAAQELGAEHHRFAPTIVGEPGDASRWHPAGAGEDEAVAAGQPAGPMYGVGLVSKWPVLQWRIERFHSPAWRIPLVVPGPQRRPQIVRVPDEPRAAIIAVIDSPLGVMTVVTAHLSFIPGVNIRQLRDLVRRTADLPRPFILLGDFNIPGRLPSVITRMLPLAKGATYPSFRPAIQFDHVLADGLPPTIRTHATVSALGISDHCAVSVDLQ
jgi:endonuclease/exonuclease/phosphatase family metal-dependent hydrolase